MVAADIRTPNFNKIFNVKAESGAKPQKDAWIDIAFASPDGVERPYVVVGLSNDGGLRYGAQKKTGFRVRVLGSDGKPRMGETDISLAVLSLPRAD